MTNLWSRLQPAVKEETKKVFLSVSVCVGIMWVVFLIAHFIIPEKVPMDYTVILGGIGGGMAAVLNFFLMALAVQKAASADAEDMARTVIKASYSRRMLIQMLWVILAITLPCFQPVAGIIPLLFPSTVIKLRGIFNKV